MFLTIKIKATCLFRIVLHVEGVEVSRMFREVDFQGNLALSQRPLRLNTTRFRWIEILLRQG